MPRKPKTKTLTFANKLVLNQWVLSLLGIDPLREHFDDKRQVRPFHLLAKTLRDCREGLADDGLHHFYHHLKTWQKPDPNLPELLSDAALLRYEENIVAHTRWLNEGREQPIEWKYYQWLALLFVEIYLDQYFGDREQLLDRLNDFVQRFNTYWLEQGWQTGITPYTQDELNKLCLQCATGSGKTLLMHVNFRQFSQYAEQAGQADNIARTLLITPNEGLSRQHEKEMQGSNITAQRLVMDNNDLFAGNDGHLDRVDYIEITKLGERDGDKTIATRNLGDENLILVDEGHHGLKSSDEKGWYYQRERLTENGFTFEYSATFKEALAATKDAAIEEAYAKAVLFDYSYRWFYEDGYGKDYRIFNMPQSQADHEFVYLTACLLSFYQQLRLFEDKRAAFAPYNIEKPLWVFVGSTVRKPTGTKGERATASDIVRVLRFVARFLADPALARQTIDTLLNGNGKTTGLMDDKGHDIFHGSFLYLRKKQDGGEDAAAMHSDLLRRVFNSAGGKLHLLRLKGQGGELLLKAGNGEQHFGLINVGEARELARHVGEQCKADGQFPVVVEDSDFAQGQFATVNASSSPINLLIGAKKFIEGWDCWRVSTLGLMNVGKSEGSQIIQLFGRGVRLKGHDWSLKRSRALPLTEPPAHISYLETLNVFGVQADYMAEFKKHLEEEGLPGNDQKLSYQIPMNLTWDVGHRLKVLRPRRKDDSGREYNFNRDGAMPLFGDVPEKLTQNPVQVDWYPRIAAIVSDGARHEADAVRNEAHFNAQHVAFLDIDALYFELEQYKAREHFYSLIIRRKQISALLQNTDWYRLYVPEEIMQLDNYANVRIRQQIALALLKGYCRKFFRHCTAAFIEPRLETRLLDADDPNLPEAMNGEYHITVDASEAQLVADIEKLQADIQKAVASHNPPLKTGPLKASLLANHLYQPLLYVEKGSAIKVSPVALNDSEMTFVADLTDWLKTNSQQLEADGTQLYLLRNRSRGKGIGFFEAGNFYPDFILWLVNGDQQTVIFVEPHGITHERPNDPKIVFHETIKYVEARLPDNNVRLESFIITPTRFASVMGSGLTLDEWANHHVYFMHESAPYIDKMLVASCA